MYSIRTGLSILSLFFSVSFLFAQQIDPNNIGYYPLVSRFTQNGVYGTARMQGLGGCGVALGADLSSAAMNPAGLGLYNKNDMGGTMAFGVATSKTTYTTSTYTKDSKAWFGLPNLGLSFYTEATNPKSSFKGGSFAITFTKVNNYQNQFSYSGANTSNNMVQSFVEGAETANGTGIDYQTLANDAPTQDVGGTVSNVYSLAFNTFLIDHDNSSGAKNTDYIPLVSMGTTMQRGTVITSGGQYRWDLAYGANINNKLYVGAGLGIAIIRYKFEHQYNESPTIPNGLVGYTFYDYDLHKSTGINVKAGLIYRASDRVRLALTAQSPTYQPVREEYHSRINAQWDNYVYVDAIGNPHQLSPVYDLSTNSGFYRYRYNAPPRVEGGFSYFFNKNGFVTGSLEYVPYGLASFKDPSSSFTFLADNTTIKNIYRNGVNVKAGIELRKDIYYYRAGFAYTPDPYVKAIDNNNRDQLSITAGWGVRTETFYFDLALVNTRFKGIYKPYTVQNGTEPTAAFSSSLVQFVATFGILY